MHEQISSEGGIFVLAEWNYNEEFKHELMWYRDLFQFNEANIPE